MGSVFSNTVFSRVKDGGGVGRLGEGWNRVAGPEGGGPNKAGDGVGSSRSEADCSCICSERAVAAVGCRKAKSLSSSEASKVDKALVWLRVTRGENLPASAEDGAEVRCDIVQCEGATKTTA